MYPFLLGVVCIRVSSVSGLRINGTWRNPAKLSILW